MANKKSKGFNHSHSLGQNFLVDPSVCPRIASEYDDKGYGILEIGPGQGALTRELAKAAGKVAAIEIDTRLTADLEKLKKEFPNVDVTFGDVMQFDLKSFLCGHLGEYKKKAVCANLPYYITSPIIMLLLEGRLDIESITVMVQKEAAERLCAPIPSRECGAVTYAVKYYCDSQILFDVGREAFDPVPQVDSCVIKLVPRATPPVEIKSPDFFFKVVKAGFAQRRKTLNNSLSSLGIDKATLQNAMQAAGISPTARMEELSFEQTANLADLLYKG